MKNEASNKLKITVIIPCFNDGSYIDDAINSILNQTYQNYEIVVVNDGSTDTATIKKLRNMKYPRTTVLHKKNGGVSTARNFGVKHSQTEYLLFLDADDVIENTFLEKGVEILDKNPKIGVVSCYTRYFYEMDFDKTINYYKPKGGGVENFLLENNACSNSLIRFQCWSDVGGYDENLLSHEDWDFWIRITKNGWLVYTIPEVLANYRVTKKSKYDKHKHKKPELIKRIIENNKDVYKKYVVHCLYEKEKQVQDYKKRIDIIRQNFRKSYNYIIGFYITYPIRLGKKLFR